MALVHLHMSALSLDRHTDLTGLDQPSRRGVQKFHTDWLCILPVTHDYPTWFLNCIYRGIFPKKQEKDI